MSVHPPGRAAVWLVAAALCAGLPARAEPRVEYQLQAAYVSKFLRFVEWPEARRPGEIFRVGVVGNGEFRVAMAALDGYAVGEGEIAVTTPEDLRALEDLHVLVLGPSSEKRALDFLLAARELPILTVSDAEDFNDVGGIIQFVVVDDAMRFRVNVAAADRVDLSVSSRLLRLAVHVQRRWSP